MNRIIISEEDISTNYSETLLNPTVFIPGFAASGDAEVGVPYTCNTLQEFIQHFGATGATFPVGTESLPAHQYYPIISDGHAGFATSAYPDEDNPIMFLEGTIDPSYVYASELLTKGVPVVYVRMNTITDPTDSNYDVTVERAYSYMSSTIFNVTTSPILSKGTYDIKYITSGGYPVFEHSSNLDIAMLTIAKTRGDCAALIDHTAYKARPLTGTDSVFAAVNTTTYDSDIDTFGAMFTPAVECTLAGSSIYGVSTMVLPASFAYLYNLAIVANSTNAWVAVAGVTRGQSTNVISLWTLDKLTTEIADSYAVDLGDLGSATYHTSINPIVYVQGYGYCIWGNRTLRNALINRAGYCLNFLNVRAVVSDVKKLAYKTALKYMFETNTDMLFLNFKADIEVLLAKMQSANALFGYRILKLSSSDKSTLKCNIRISPTSVVEKFDIKISVTDDETNITE